MAVVRGLASATFEQPKEQQATSHVQRLIAKHMPTPHTSLSTLYLLLDILMNYERNTANLDVSVSHAGRNTLECWHDSSQT
jgi:hypothetical protein